MSYNYSKLRGRIKEKFGTEGMFAKRINRDCSTFSKKINNKGEFTSDEIFRMAKLLDIPDDEIGVYFFTQKVEK